MNNPTNPKYNINHIPILKSNLQKCVRRSLNEFAINTALCLMILDPNELLRRLPIIILEDVILHEDYTFLVWLMCAVSKNLKINDFFLDKCLNIVNDISINKNREIVNPNIQYKKIDLRKIEKDDFSNFLNSKQKNLLWSIELRKSYGGMNGDMKMLNYFTNKWYDKFKNNYNYELILKKNLKIDYKDFT